MLSASRPAYARQAQCQPLYIFWHFLQLTGAVVNRLPYHCRLSWVFVIPNFRSPKPKPDSDLSKLESCLQQNRARPCLCNRSRQDDTACGLCKRSGDRLTWSPKLLWLSSKYSALYKKQRTKYLNKELYNYRLRLSILYFRRSHSVFVSCCGSWWCAMQAAQSPWRSQSVFLHGHLSPWKRTYSSSSGLRHTKLRILSFNFISDMGFIRFIRSFVAFRSNCCKASFNPLCPVWNQFIYPHQLPLLPKSIFLPAPITVPAEIYFSTCTVAVPAWA